MTVPLVGTEGLASVTLPDKRSLPPFSTQVMEFLADLSGALLRDSVVRQYPDLVTFAFWCRRAALEREKAKVDTSDRLGRGRVFHIAPSNVPVNFAYSLVAGLLAGNSNVVRLPSKQFGQVDVLASALERMGPQHGEIDDYITLVRYDRTDKAVTDNLSRQCDVRVIWGGDETIADVRRSPLPPRAYDVTFADRYSLCVIDAGAYLALDDASSVAQGFYNDTYLFDQNACTAPHLVVWLGSAAAVGQAQRQFWAELHQLVAREYVLESVAAVDKLTASYRFAATHEACHVQRTDDNLIIRAQVEELPADIEDFRSTCGLFYERHASSLTEVGALVTRRYQTLSYLGLDRQLLADFVVGQGLHGIDRIVPVGQTLDFDLRWDGFNLIETLSRVVVTR